MTLPGVRVVIANWRDPDHSLAGGSERYAWEFATALATAGADVEFLTAREPGQSRRDERDGIQIVRGGGRLTFYFYAAWRLTRQRRRIDLVVDADCGIPVFSPLFVSRRTRVVLLVHHVHLAQFGTHLPAPLAAIGRFLERVAMPLIYRRSLTVAVSKSTRDEMHRQLAWRSPVELLPNGNSVPLDFSIPPVSTDRIVVLGRLVAHKRVDLVIESFAQLQSERGNLHLDIVGKGPERARLEQVAADLGVGHRVTFHGFIDEQAKARVLSQARLQVCASDAEGWGQVVLEAASYGVPTVARDVPGLRDSVLHQKTGWLIRPTTVGATALRLELARAISGALEELSDEEHRLDLSKNCRLWAGEHTWEAMRAGSVAVAQAALEQGAA